MIKTENLNFYFKTENETGNEEKTEVLKNVNIEINEAEFVAVLGHNGSGKSTLAKHFNGLLLPMGGTVFVDGINTLDDDNYREVRKNVGMVFQNPDNQLVASVVEEDVAFAPENLGVPPEEIRKRVCDALKSVGMYEYRKHAPHLLSGGQKQRVAIAGVLAMKPKYIVLDEPTAMLDPIGRKEVLNAVCRLKEENNMSVVLITHYMEEAVKADRVVIINDGEILTEGKPREVFSKVEMLKSVGLDVPQSTELMWRLNKTVGSINYNVLNYKEAADELMKHLGAAKNGNQH